MYAVRLVRLVAMGSRVSCLTQWKAAGIRTSAMGGFCFCFNMFQLHILFLPILLHGSMGANVYGTQSCGAMLFLNHSCSIMQRVIFLLQFDNLKQSIPAEEFASQSAT